MVLLLAMARSFRPVSGLMLWLSELVGLLCLCLRLVVWWLWLERWVSGLFRGEIGELEIGLGEVQ